MSSATSTSRRFEWLQGVADPVRLDVLGVLSEKEQVTVADLFENCQASRATLRRHLEALVVSGLVLERAGESDGLTAGRPAARFNLSPAIRESVQQALTPRGTLETSRSEPPPGSVG